MERPGEGLVRRAARLEQELKREQHTRAKEASLLNDLFGHEKLAVDAVGEGLRSLQERVAALEKQLEDCIQKERDAREVDVHVLREVLQHEIIAREGLSSFMHEVFMSNVEASNWDALQHAPASLPAERHLEKARELGKRAVSFEEDAEHLERHGSESKAVEKAAGHLERHGSESKAVKEAPPPHQSLEFGEPEVTRSRSSPEQQPVDEEAYFAWRLQDNPPVHQLDDVQDLCWSLNESLPREHEAGLPSVLGATVHEQQQLVQCQAPESETPDPSSGHEHERSSKSSSGRVSLGSRLQKEFTRLSQQRAGGNLGTHLSVKSSADDELSGEDSIGTPSSVDFRRLEERPTLIEWSMQQRV